MISAPTSIVISRTCDYHHHYQDVVVGSIIGLVLAYVCYRLYYPRLSSINSHLPYECILDKPNDNGNFDGVLPLYNEQHRMQKHHKYTLLKPYVDKHQLQPSGE